MNLSHLPNGHQVFVEFRSVVKDVLGKFYTGTVHDQQPDEYGGSVRVMSDAVRHLHAKWKSASFRWSNGEAVTNPWLILRVAESQEEHDRFAALVGQPLKPARTVPVVSQFPL